MKKSLIIIPIISFLLLSCSNIDSSESFSDSSFETSSSQERDILSHDEKMKYYNDFGGGNVYTWVLPDSTREFACLGKWKASITRAYNYNTFLYVQNKAPLTLEEANEYIVSNLDYGDQFSPGVILYEIPYPITEEFYYDDYLMTSPSPHLFVQDKEVWDSVQYTRYGYEYLLKKGYILPQE